MSRLFAQPFVQAQIKENSKFRVTGICGGNPPRKMLPFGDVIREIGCSMQMSAPRTITRPGEERDAGRILEMTRQQGWVLPTEPMLMDNLRHGVVWVTTDDKDHILSE